MSDAAADEAYNALITWLKENKLEWLAEQIEAEALLGKTEPQRISIPEHPDFERTVLVAQRIVPPKRESAEFLVRVPYSPRERFSIALSAIRVVVIGTIKLQDSLAHTINLDDGEISFVPGETGSIDHRYRSSDIATQRQAIDQAEVYLRQLEEDVSK